MRKVGLASRASWQSVVISSGTTASPVSAVVDLRDAEYLAITPPVMTSSQLTFKVGPSSSSDATFYDLFIGSSQVVLVISTLGTRAHVLAETQLFIAPFKYMQIVGSSTGGEAAARTLLVATK